MSLSSLPSPLSLSSSVQACRSLHQDVHFEYRTAAKEAYMSAVDTACTIQATEFTSVRYTPKGLAAWKERVTAIYKDAVASVSGWTVTPEVKTEYDTILSSLDHHGKELVKSLEDAVVRYFLSFPAMHVCTCVKECVCICVGDCVYICMCA
jgi:hypothetical protein